MITLKEKKQIDSYNFPYHYLDLKVEEYKLILHVEYLNYLNIIKGFLQPFNGQLLLDAGCGDGRFCYELRDENIKTVGIDYSERAISFAKAFNPSKEFYQRDLRNPQFPYLFEQIVLIETLEHFKPEDIPLILKNLCKALKDDGIMIVSVPTTKSPLIPKHYQHFTEDSLRELLSEYFKITKCVGYSKSGSLRNKYVFIRDIADSLFGMRKRMKFLYKMYDFLNSYSEKHFAIGKSAECFGLIAVCKKKNSNEKGRKR